MKMKTYAGKSLTEIVPRIREELGPDAVILKQRPIRSGGVGGFFARTGVEVLAGDGSMGAADFAPAPASPARPTPAPAPTRNTTPTTAAPSRATVDAHDSESRDALLRATFSDALRAQVEREEAADEPVTPASSRAAADAAYTNDQRRFEPARITATRTPRGRVRIAPQPLERAPLDDEAEDLVLELERSGIALDAAESLVRAVQHHVEPFGGGRLRDLVRARIADRIRVEQGYEPDGSARRIAVVGGSGAGKTTAIANLAVGLTDSGLTVGIVVASRRDDAAHPVLPRLGAAAGSEADRALAYMAGADVLRVTTATEMHRAVERLHARDAVLIDTPGIAIGDEPGAAMLRTLLDAATPHETHAVVPLGTADREIAATLSRLARVGANRLLVSKTDEARFAGPLYGLATVYDLPLSYLASGPRVPGDLRVADGVSIAERILPK